MSKCKYYKQQKQVSWDSGQTWSNVSPAVYQVGNLYEMDSIDCSHGSSQIRWVVVPGDYLCDGKDKYVKEIEQYSVDGGETWLNVYPTTYRKGRLIESNSNICDYKWEGHYIDDTTYDPTPPIQHDCPKWYKWVDGVGCVYVDPVKIVRCSTSSSTTLTSSDITYRPYKLIYGFIGDCVTTIGQYAFSKSEISDIRIPSGVTLIDSSAFSSCTELETCIIDGNATSGTVIGDYAFYDCSALTSMTIGNGVTYIGRYAFYDCGALAGIDLPDTVTTIDEHAFQRCSGLTSATIESGSIGYAAFYYCTELTSIELGSGVTSIGDYAFNNCSSLTGVTIPSGVTSINRYAFSNCDSLSFIDFGNVTAIGEEAFASCGALTNVNIPNSVTSIGNEAFYYGGLTSVTIGSGVTSMGYWVFYGSSGLTGITILAPTPPSIMGSTFDNTNNCPIYVPCDSLISYKREWNVVYDRIYPIPPCETPPVPTNYKLYETYSGETYNLVECDSATTLTSGETGSYLVSRDKIVAASIGNCVTTIRNSAFYECTNLSSVTISDSVTSIGNSVFNKCYSLSSITIPNSVTTIGQYAFASNSGLTNITIGSGITIIGDGALSYCSNLTSVTCLASVPPTLSGNTVFAFSDNCTVYVPCDSVIAYRAADRWKAIKSRIQGIPPCVVPLKLNATYINSTVYELDCDDSSTLTEGEVTSFTTSRTAMTSAIIGDCVTTIGDYAFYNCTSLTSVDIPNSVTRINYDAFTDCSGLTNVTIPDSVTSIGAGAFYNCTSLTSCTIGSGVTTIGRSAFENCSGITSINIPGSVESLGADAFESCYGITSIDIPDSVETIGTGMCQYCRSLTSVTIGNGITSIGSYAFAYCGNLASFTITKVTPPILENDRQYGGHPHIFDNVNNLVIYVPSQSVQTYKTASGWSEYASRIQAIP